MEIRIYKHAVTGYVQLIYITGEIKKNTKFI